MANRNFDMEYAIGKRLIHVTGSFLALTGAGTVDATKVKGFGFGYAPVAGVMALQATARPGISSTPGVVRTGTGVYTVTLDDSYRDFNFGSADLSAATSGGTALWAQFVTAPTNLGASGLAPTFTIVIVNSSGTPTDAGANQRVFFDIQLEDSTVQFNKP